MSLAALRSGSWLTSQRLRAYPTLISIILGLGIAALVLTGHGNLDHWDRPLGVDFSGVWVAGQEVLAGHPAQPYDNAAHAAAQAAVFGTPDSFLPWSYPPYLLPVAALLAAMPYLLALAVWQALTGCLYLTAVLRSVRGAGLVRRDVIVAALAFPAVAINVVHGQNGFLSAGLMALGAFLLSTRPILAGVLMGLLAYKPQLAMVVPVALIAGGHWRPLHAAAATAALMTALTLLAYGPAPWHAFGEGLGFARRVILESGGLESWKLQSAFGAIRLWGGCIHSAYIVQGLVTLAVVTTLAGLWRGGADQLLKIAGLLIAALLATPYTVDYDMVLLGPALAALVAYDTRSTVIPRAFARSLMAIAWAMPLLARPAAMTCALPVGFAVTGALYVLVLRSAWSEAAADDSGRRSDLSERTQHSAEAAVP